MRILRKRRYRPLPWPFLTTIPVDLLDFARSVKKKKISRRRRLELKPLAQTQTRWNKTWTTPQGRDSFNFSTEFFSSSIVLCFLKIFGVPSKTNLLARVTYSPLPYFSRAFQTAAATLEIFGALLIGRSRVCIEEEEEEGEKIIPRLFF